MGNIRVKVSNSTTLGASDFAVSNGQLVVAGVDNYNANMIQAINVIKNAPAVPSVVTATATSVASTSYILGVEGYINGDLEVRRFEYTTATGSTTTSATAMAAAFNTWAALQGFDATLSASSSTADVTFSGTGSATNIFINFIGVLNVTAAQNMGTLTLAASAAQVVGDPITITFSASHGLKTGQTIKFGTVSTGGANATLIANKAFRVISTGSGAPTVVTLDGTAAAVTTAINGGTVTVVAQPDFGSVAYVNNDAAANGFEDQEATATTYQYAMIEIVGGYPVDATPESADRVVTTRYWCPENLKAANYTAANAAFIAAAVAL